MSTIQENNQENNESTIRESLKNFDKAIKLNPEDYEAHLNKGIINAQKGNTTLAIKSFDNAIKVDPNASGAYTNKAIALMEKNDSKGAIELIKKAHKIDPNDDRIVQIKNMIQQKFDL